MSTCHVFKHCFGSFLFQAMFLSLQVFAFKGKNMKLREDIVYLYSCILRCDAGSAVITTVCKYGSRLLSRISYLS